MEQIQLGKSALRASRLGVGGCPLGGHGWGAVDHENLLDAVRSALEHGVTFFDTADVYGRGESELILGRELRNVRASIVLATKFGVRLGEKGTFYDNSPEWIREAVVGSLQRLQTDYIDLYQIHYWDRQTPWPVIFETLEGLIEAGMIRAVGLSNVVPADLGSTTIPPWVVSVQLQYSLVDRLLEGEILDWCTQNNLAFLSWGSLGQGILTGKYRNGVQFNADDRRSREVYSNFHGAKFEFINQLLAEMDLISSACGRSLGQIALRWILDKIPTSIALVGVKTRVQLEQNLGGLDWQLSPEQIAKLDELSKIFASPKSHERAA